MKTVIVRTPETDRKLIEIPDSVLDFSDYVAPTEYVPTYTYVASERTSTSGVLEFGTWDTIAIASVRLADGLSGDGSSVTVDAGRGGKFLVVVRVKLEADEDYKLDMDVAVRVNGTTDALSARFGRYALASGETLVLVGIIELSAGDDVTVRVRANSGAKISTGLDAIVETTYVSLDLVRIST